MSELKPKVAHLSISDEPNRICDTGDDRPVTSGLDKPLLQAASAARALGSRRARVVTEGTIDVW